MKAKPVKRAEAEVALCKSKETGKLYYTIMENGMPVKYWAYDDMSEAAKDFISELINAFDLGYDIRCQFPVEKDGKKLLMPRTVAMFNEPGSKKKKSNVTEEFFRAEEPVVEDSTAEETIAEAILSTEETASEEQNKNE